MSNSPAFQVYNVKVRDVIADVCSTDGRDVDPERDGASLIRFGD